MSGFAYLDHNATSPLRPAALEAMIEALRLGGNPSAVHRSGRRARSLVERSRQRIATFVSAAPAEIVFTSGGTEANNMALAGSGRLRLLISAVEHESVRRAALGAVDLPVDADGVLDLATLERKLAESDAPALVSVMLANNETGVMQPVADIVRIAHQAGALVHCDAVQAAGKVAIDLHRIGVDYLSLSAHKLGGPTGIGALVVREGAPFVSNRLGGGQERNRRAGTENLSGIVGFGMAAEDAVANSDIVKMRDRLEAALLAIAPQARIFGVCAPRLPNTTCISMPEVAAETQVVALDLAGVCVSAGSACSSGKVHRSSVLAAMGVDERVAGTAIRISLGWNSRHEDIDRLIGAWRDLYIRAGKSDMPDARAA
jgi:cysteine desulfurase